MNDEKRFFVYVDYTTEIEPRPYYVGKGVQVRVRSRRARNRLHTNIGEKHGLDRRCVFGPCAEQEAFAEEVRLIAEHKTYFYGGDDHWGCNFTRGGDGSAGHRAPPITEEHREILRAVNSHPKSKETREKMKEAARQRAANPEWREKMRQVALKRWQDPDYRAKKLGEKRSETTKKRMSEAQKKRWKKHQDNE